MAGQGAADRRGAPGSRQAADLEALLGPTIEALGCALWGIEVIRQPKSTLVRIYIDREDGVSIDDCEAVSRQVSGVLDVEDPIAGGFTLEVSSPGMDRILFRPEQYAESIGAIVDVRLVKAFDGRRHLKGVLTGLEDDEIVVRVDDEEYSLPLEWVQRTRIVPTFD